MALRGFPAPVPATPVFASKPLTTRYRGPTLKGRNISWVFVVFSTRDVPLRSGFSSVVNRSEAEIPLPFHIFKRSSQV